LTDQRPTHSRGPAPPKTPEKPVLTYFEWINGILEAHEQPERRTKPAPGQHDQAA